MSDKRYLLLASYCDENGCSDELPCRECIEMCNVVTVEGKIKNVIGGYDYLKGMTDE
jgi:hypothetical protein